MPKGSNSLRQVKKRSNIKTEEGIMKKFMIGLLMMSMLMGGAACSKQPTAITDKGSVGYYREWGAAEDGVKHDTFALIDPDSPTGESTGGRKNADGDWEAQWIYTQKKSTVLTEMDNIMLSPGYYKFVCNTSIGNVDVSFNYYTHDIIAEMRVQESGTGKNVAFRSVVMEEFGEQGVFQDVALYFYLDKETAVDVFFCAKNRIRNIIHSFRIEGIRAEEYLVQDYASLLCESEADKKLTYDPNALYVFRLWDYIAPITDTRVSYDIVSIAVALQGLANRTGEHIFLSYVESTNSIGVAYYNGNVDDYWLEELTKEGNELADKKVVEVDTLGALLRLFGDRYNGLVVWDEGVPSTYNVACTAAGADDLLPVRYDSDPYSLYNVLIDDLGMNVALDLYGKFNGKGTIWGTDIKSTGSKKCDPYLWAKHYYLDAGKTNPTLMCNHLDATTWDVTWELGEQVVMYDELQQCMLINKDYYIQNKAFFWDLSCYGDFAPGDDLTQPVGTDFKVLTQILEKQNELAGDEFIEIGGFVAWFFPKYTDAMGLYPDFPQAVPAEWRWSEVFGWYNAVTHADAFGGTVGVGPFANASVYTHIPCLDSYTQTGNSEMWFNAETNRLEPVELDLQNYNYICIYMGDFDSAAWMNNVMINEFFNDPHRGDVPLCWPIVTNLVNRAPHVVNRLYSRASAQDYFTAGDNGFGYNHVGSYISENRPTRADGTPLNGTLETYYERTAYEFEKFGIDFHSFLLSVDGSNPEVENMFAKLCPAGILSNYSRGGDHPNLIDVNNTPDDPDDDVPFLQMGGIANDTEYWYRQFLSQRPAKPTFNAFRAICVSPSEIYNGAVALQSIYRMRIVDPYTFMKLYKEALIRGLC